MADMCACGHGREWHERCSKCNCPFFLSPDADKKGWLAQTWLTEKKKRAQREKGRS